MTKLVSTFDDQYVVSAGADGNLFVFKFNSQLEAPTLPSVAAGVSDKVIMRYDGVLVIILSLQVTSPPDNIQDIEDPNAYR